MTTFILGKNVKRAYYATSDDTYEYPPEVPLGPKAKAWSEATLEVHAIVPDQGPINWPLLEVARDAFLAGDVKTCRDMLWRSGIAIGVSTRVSSGDVYTEREARRLALQYNASLYLDDPGEIIAFNERNGTSFRSSMAIAKYIAQVDGDYHGLDIHDEERDARGITRVLVGTGWNGGANRLFPGVERWSFSPAAPDQAAAIKTMPDGTLAGRSTYERIVSFLHDADLMQSKADFEVIHVGECAPRSCRGYVWGSGWLYHKIPLKYLEAAQRACVPNTERSKEVA